MCASRPSARPTTPPVCRPMGAARTAPSCSAVPPGAPPAPCLFLRGPSCPRAPHSQPFAAQTPPAPHLKLTTGPTSEKMSFSCSSVASYGMFPTADRDTETLPLSPGAPLTPPRAAEGPAPPPLTENGAQGAVHGRVPHRQPRHAARTAPPPASAGPQGGGDGGGAVLREGAPGRNGARPQRGPPAAHTPPRRWMPPHAPRVGSTGSLGSHRRCPHVPLPPWPPWSEVAPSWRWSRSRASHSG